MVKINRKEAEPIKEGHVSNRLTSLYYKKMGQGMLLIMLHGSDESHEIFARLPEFMSRYYRVTLMDGRGHGSPPTKEEVAEGDLTIPDVVADVVQAIKLLHVPRVVVLDFSDGANTALETVSCYPRHVFTMMAVSGNILSRGTSITPLMEVKLKHTLWRGPGEVPLPRGVRGRAVKGRQLLDLMTGWPRLDKDRPSCTQVPILTLTGRRDMIRSRHSLWMGEQIPDLRVALVKGTNHFTSPKKEKAYGAYIMAWLRQRGF